MTAASIPVEPFTAWCRRRLRRLQYECANLEDGDRVLGPRGQLVAECGWDHSNGLRRLYRYLNEGQETAPRADIEDALHHAGVGFWEVYGVEPVDVRSGYCVDCSENVPVDADGECLWCEPTPAPRRLPRGPFLAWLRALHAEHGSWRNVGHLLGVHEDWARRYTRGDHGSDGVSARAAARAAARASTTVEAIWELADTA